MAGLLSLGSQQLNFFSMTILEYPTRTAIRQNKVPPSEALAFIQRLRDLNQPWNRLLRAFVRLRELPDAVTRWRPMLAAYGYSETPLKDGTWFLPGSKTPQDAPVPLGIVLNHVFEVSIRDRWTIQVCQTAVEEAEDKANPDKKPPPQVIEKQRLAPVAMLPPGAGFGTFESHDQDACIAPLKNYEVSAGSRAFKIVPSNGDSLRSRNGKFLKLHTNSSEWHQWKAGQADHDALIRYYGLHRPGSGQRWTAEMLLLTSTPADPTPEERDLLAAVHREAWRQARHMHEWYMASQRHDPCPNDFLSNSHRLLAAPASKFVRKLKLAASEEFIVFGHPAQLNDYGPLGDLVANINQGLGDRNEQLKDTDILVPMLLHDSGRPCYLSLSDDALEPIQLDEYKPLRIATEKAVQLVKDALGTAGCTTESALRSGGRADLFWRASVRLTSRFPSLPCLEAVARELGGAHPFEGCVLVLAQHLLEETGSLLQTLFDLGGRGLASRTYILGKPYSSNVRVWQRIKHLQVQVEDLFSGDRSLRRVLVVDDGGVLLETLPEQLVKSATVVGVEQTSRGLAAAARCQFPVVAVACSAAKKRLEPPIVAETIWNKLKVVQRQACAGPTMAVCGLGNVGLALAKFIYGRFTLGASNGAPGGRKLWLYDRRPQALQGLPLGARVIRAPNLAEAFKQADVLFGCTGTDLTDGLLRELDAIGDGRPRYLVSCSSLDIEFVGLLKRATLKTDLSPFELAVYENPKQTKFFIAQAGFPVTFDRTPCAAPTEEMQVTRALLLAGLLQAASLAQSASRPQVPNLLALDTSGQRLVVRAWRKAKVRPVDQQEEQELELARLPLLGLG
jgi:hypothetical protein